MFQIFWLALFYVWKIEDIGKLGMLPICGWHKSYLKFVDIDDMAKFSVGNEKVAIISLIDQNLVFRTLIFADLKFFEKWHFFHKKWLINIYFTFQNHNSLRKKDSKSGQIFPQYYDLVVISSKNSKIHWKIHLKKKHKILEKSHWLAGSNIFGKWNVESGMWKVESEIFQYGKWKINFNRVRPWDPTKTLDFGRRRSICFNNAQSR